VLDAAPARNGRGRGVQAKADEAHERQPVAQLEFRLLVGEAVEGL
jgi:hypothetical protein